MGPLGTKATDFPLLCLPTLMFFRKAVAFLLPSNRTIDNSVTLWFVMDFQVVARFNEVVTNLLLQGALETFERCSVKPEDITVRIFSLLVKLKLFVEYFTSNIAPDFAFYYHYEILA